MDSEEVKKDLVVIAHSNNRNVSQLEAKIKRSFNVENTTSASDTIDQIGDHNAHTVIVDMNITSLQPNLSKPGGHDVFEFLLHLQRDHKEREKGDEKHKAPYVFIRPTEKPTDLSEIKRFIDKYEGQTFIVTNTWTNDNSSINKLIQKTKGKAMVSRIEDMFNLESIIPYQISNIQSISIERTKRNYVVGITFNGSGNRYSSENMDQEYLFKMMNLFYGLCDSHSSVEIEDCKIPQGIIKRVRPILTRPQKRRQFLIMGKECGEKYPLTSPSYRRHSDDVGINGFRNVASFFKFRYNIYLYRKSNESVLGYKGSQRPVDYIITAQKFNLKSIMLNSI